MQFIKAHCNYNSFLITHKYVHINERQKIFNKAIELNIDGVIFVNMNIDGYDYKIDYYNNNGTWETWCANGAMCVAKYLYQEKMITKKASFLAGDGKHKISILDQNGSSVHLKMIKPQYIKNNIDVAEIYGNHIDSGAQHFVSRVDDINISDVLKLSQKIRYSTLFSPSGINVNYYQIINKHLIKTLTYEKEIEKMMQSCASGSVASVFDANNSGYIESPAIINTPGGDISIEFNQDWSDVWISSVPTIIEAIDI
tara:strand:+ start:1440 stop:2204 length:765 start_codon:yes stop_codon:yes gene_type:complete